MQCTTDYSGVHHTSTAGHGKPRETVYGLLAKRGRRRARSCRNSPTTHTRSPCSAGPTTSRAPRQHARTALLLPSSSRVPTTPPETSRPTRRRRATPEHQIPRRLAPPPARPSSFSLRGSSTALQQRPARRSPLAARRPHPAPHRVARANPAAPRCVTAAFAVFACN